MSDTTLLNIIASAAEEWRTENCDLMHKRITEPVVMFGRNGGVAIHFCRPVIEMIPNPIDGRVWDAKQLRWVRPPVAKFVCICSSAGAGACLAQETAR